MVSATISRADRFSRFDCYRIVSALFCTPHSPVVTEIIRTASTEHEYGSCDGPHGAGGGNSGMPNRGMRQASCLPRCEVNGPKFRGGKILLPGAWDRVRYSRTSCDFRKRLISNGLSVSVQTPTRSPLDRCRWRRKKGPLWRVEKGQRCGYAMDFASALTSRSRQQFVSDTLRGCRTATLVALRQLHDLLVPSWKPLSGA